MNKETAYNEIFASIPEVWKTSSKTQNKNVLIYVRFLTPTTKIELDWLCYLAMVLQAMRLTSALHIFWAFLGIFGIAKTFHLLVIVA